MHDQFEEAAVPTVTPIATLSPAALFRIIRERDLRDPDVYRRANIDRKLFSKIRSDRAYTPRKGTCLALAVALRMSIPETREFIGRAGFCLTRSSRRDIVVEYFIEHRDWNIFHINQVLYALKLPQIGT